MAKYYVSEEPHLHGTHEVHAETCMYLPLNVQYLGEFTNCYEAVRAAKEYYSQVNGCYTCSRPCHADG
jgi:hypothetical protein